ncbi:MAG: response regulator transcription factor [Myxococcota bacterium]
MTNRVLIVEDHPMVRHGLRALIEAAGYTVHAEVTRARDALPFASEVDVAVVDIGLGTESGLELARTWPKEGAPIVLFTMYDEYVGAALAAGVRGYVLKEDPKERLLECLAAVLRGEVFVTPELQSLPADPAQLTPMERRVLQQVADHQTSRAIAANLSITLRTVQNHRANAVAKLGLRGPGALLRWCLEHVHELQPDDD